MTTKLTDAQFGALHTLREFGPKHGVLVYGPATMNSRRKAKLECHVMNAATMMALEERGLIRVERGGPLRPKDATGRKGNPRIPVKIEITDAGRALLDAHCSH